MPISVAEAGGAPSGRRGADDRQQLQPLVALAAGHGGVDQERVRLPRVLQDLRAQLQASGRRGSYRSSSCGVIRRLSALGVLVGTAESAALPALMAATAPDPASFYGPQGLGGTGGAPGPQDLWKPLGGLDDAARSWDLSERLTGVVLGQR